MDKHEWLGVIALLSLILGLILVGIDMVGYGVLLLIIFGISVVLIKLGVLKGK